MSYSDNVYKLLKTSEETPLNELFEKYKASISNKLNKGRIDEQNKVAKPDEPPEYEPFDAKYKEEKRVKLKFKDPAAKAQYDAMSLRDQITLENYVVRMKKLAAEKGTSETPKATPEDISSYQGTISPASGNFSPDSSQFNPATPPGFQPAVSPAYNPNSPAYAPGSPAYVQASTPSDYVPVSPVYNPNSPEYAPSSSASSPENILEVENETEKKTDGSESNAKGGSKTVSFELKPGVVENSSNGQTKTIKF